MKTHEKVKINLSEKAKSNPPLKLQKRNNGRPDQTHFKFVPKAFPFLSDYVASVGWDAASRTVNLMIGETAELDVLRWIRYITQQYEETQKSPFIDIEWNWVNLVLLDDADKEVGTIKLKNVNIVGHNCNFHKASNKFVGLDLGKTFLHHNISLSYQEAEIVPPVPKEESVVVADPNKLSDKEWQTMETP